MRFTNAAMIVLSTSFAVPSAIAADGQVERKPPASQQNPAAEHAPTNRMDKLVPPMTGDKAAAPSASPNSDKNVAHPPTNRVGSDVPQMKSDDARKADQSGATTGNAQKPAQN